jgi:hypothetical protein
MQHHVKIRKFNLLQHLEQEGALVNDKLGNVRRAEEFLSVFFCLT